MRQGGSTITQQLAKTNFLSSDRTIKRKAQEIIIAFWLEAWLTKQEILSRYLSSVYFGDGVYGLRAAAHHYFNRDPEKLTLAQSAMLAGHGPGAVAARADAAISPPRRSAANWSSAAMADTGVISPRACPCDGARAAGRRSLQGPDRYLFRRLGHALCAEGVRNRLRRGQGADDARRGPAADGGARRRPRRASAMRRRRWSRCVPTAASSRWSAARATRIRPFNRVTQARRQPGSAFKLFVYLAALRAGWTPDSMIEDKPITIGGWTPVNSDRVYRGQITLREAFARSSNAATVRLSQAIGRNNVIRAARDLGITTPLPDKPSIALGTAGVSLLELTSAYAAVASGRYPIVARGLPEEQAPEGLAAFFRRDGTLDQQRDRAPMLDLLYAAANNGTGRRAALAIPTFGKTGTTQENRDAFFVGFAGIWSSACGSGATITSRSARSAAARFPRRSGATFMTSALAIDRQRGPAASERHSTHLSGNCRRTSPRPSKPAAAGMERTARRNSREFSDAHRTRF